MAWTKEKQLAATRQWRLRNPEKARLDSWRHNRAMRHKKYGLTRQEYLGLYEASDGLCALCYERPAVAIDHDHGCCPGKGSCGQCVRGALCRQCNLGLGYFGDSIEALERAIEYLALVNITERTKK